MSEREEGCLSLVFAIVFFGIAIFFVNRIVAWKDSVNSRLNALEEKAGQIHRAEGDDK